MPVDPKDSAAYKFKRQKNNESARKHRERIREKVKERDEFKLKYESLLEDFEQNKKQLENLKFENIRILNLLLKHQCGTSSGLHDQACPNYDRSASNLRRLRYGRPISRVISVREEITAQKYAEPHQAGIYISNGANWSSTQESQDTVFESTVDSRYTRPPTHLQLTDPRSFGFFLDNYPPRDNDSTHSTRSTTQNPFNHIDNTMVEKLERYWEVISGVGFTPTPGHCMPGDKIANRFQKPAADSLPVSEKAIVNENTWPLYQQ
ncbi:hypothetical protein PENTCL1PPCAC_9059 [Pristionchus entomophagus]|uniref:BZIP domain-containing protein n=1 Tax=Pristionchus entomophagus TaxID=358040 RepID=A0AAV5SVG5_9BILA|nr:hypothetical protein PENTCL1PPCAC_9059 [Pristionchus entomophagus]